MGAILNSIVAVLAILPLTTATAHADAHADAGGSPPPSASSASAQELGQKLLALVPYGASHGTSPDTQQPCTVLLGSLVGEDPDALEEVHAQIILSNNQFADAEFFLDGPAPGIRGNVLGDFVSIGKSGGPDDAQGVVLTANTIEGLVEVAIVTKDRRLRCSLKK